MRVIHRWTMCGERENRDPRVWCIGSQIYVDEILYCWQSVAPRVRKSVRVCLCSSVDIYIYNCVSVCLACLRGQCSRGRETSEKMAEMVVGIFYVFMVVASARALLWLPCCFMFYVDLYCKCRFCVCVFCDRFAVSSYLRLVIADVSYYKHLEKMQLNWWALCN